MKTKHDFLFEIGVEELPPQSLLTLSESLENNVKEALQKAKLSHDKLHSYATPRRLALLIIGLDDKQEDNIIERRGPALDAPEKAVRGFAKSCDTTVDKLEQLNTAKGSWYFYKQKITGKLTTALMPEIIADVLKSLPIAKMMRWGTHDFSFVRPVHWLVMLYGKDIIAAEMFEIKSDNKTYGHRFHYPKTITINKPSDYEKLLEDKGYVIADFAKRRENIKKQIIALAADAIINDALLDEVTGLVEYPVALLGNFAAYFLKLPPEVLITTMQKHQRCFAVKNKQGKLEPCFIAISNIKSKNPQEVIAGNERVIKARLADAEFFYTTDNKKPLDSYVDKLKNIIFQVKLGSVYDKTERIIALSALMAEQLGVDVATVKRAARLTKADLVTNMVYEFPELQGIMGYYYALNAKEPKEIALALKEQYLPRFAGDNLPESKIGSIVALADRIDTLRGIFSINQAPTGAKDPFGLRRAALGVVRIMIEKNLDLDLGDLVDNKVLEFLLERLRAWYLDQGVTPQTFAAVFAAYPTRPLDFDRRIRAVTEFQKLPQAASLIAANKRVSNILKKAKAGDIAVAVDHALLEDAAEIKLAGELLVKENIYQESDYTVALTALASLKEPIDAFFDQVMVMVEDQKVRSNRLALLNKLRELFLYVADVSLLLDVTNYVS